MNSRLCTNNQQQIPRFPISVRLSYSVYETSSILLAVIVQLERKCTFCNEWIVIAVFHTRLDIDFQNLFLQNIPESHDNPMIVTSHMTCVVTTHITVTQLDINKPHTYSYMIVTSCLHQSKSHGSHMAVTWQSHGSHMAVT